MAYFPIIKPSDASTVATQLSADELTNSTKFNKLLLNLTNIVNNGDFSNEVIGWTPSNSTLSAANNTLSVTGNGASTMVFAVQTTSIPSVVGKPIYIRCMARVRNSLCTNITAVVDGSTAGTNQQINLGYPVQDTWYPMSFIAIQPSDVAGNITFKIYAQYSSVANALNAVMELKYITAIDLSLLPPGCSPTTTGVNDFLNTLPNSFLATNMAVTNFNTNTINIFNTDELFNGTATTTDTVLKTILGDVILEILTNFNSTIRVYGTKDGTNYTLLSMTNLNTGTTSTYAVYCSKYKIHSDGFTNFKFVRNFSETNIANTSPIVARLVKTANETPIRKKQSQVRSFITTNINNVVYTTTPSGVAIFGVRSGVLIGARVDTGRVVHVVQSDASYTTWTDMYTLTGETDLPKHMEVVGDNSVIITCLSGAVLRTTDLVNYTQVLSITAFPGYTGVPSTAFLYTYGGFTQLDAYNNIVILSEYNQSKNYNDPTYPGLGGKVHLSQDYGQTFTTIFDLMTNFVTVGARHIHSIKYDPYEGIIWLVTGDGYGQQSIWYTMDLGTTWNLGMDLTQMAVQMTQVVPLESCVLFLSDSRLVGVARYNRPECGTIVGAKMHLDFPYLFKEGWNSDNTSLSVPVGSRPYVDYTKNIAYFSYLSSPSVHTASTDMTTLNLGQIYATDGYNFYQVYTGSTMVNYGVIAVYGDTTNKLAFGKLGLSGQFVKINADIWT